MTQYYNNNVTDFMKKSRKECGNNPLQRNSQKQDCKKNTGARIYLNGNLHDAVYPCKKL